jgi:NitT/TauT family transport system substrate-binding protein
MPTKPPYRLRFRRIVLLALLALGCNSATTPPTKSDRGAHTKVTLLLNWYPEAEHGGFYAALVHGFFKEAGLDVEIQPGGPETPVIQQVASGRAMFGVINADNLLYGRAEQAPVVALMAPMQTSPRCIIVHESSGIRDFSQLKDMTLAMSNTQAFSFFLRKKAPLTGVKIVPYPGNVARFLTDKNYGQQGYVFSEPYVAKKNGGDPHVLMLADLGFNPYTSLLFTSEPVVAKHRELVDKMTAASVRGWQKYVADPAETNAYIHKLNPEMDLDVLEYGAKAIVPLSTNEATKRSGFGTMTRDRWQTLIDQMVDCGQLTPDAVEASDAFLGGKMPPQPVSN